MSQNQDGGHVRPFAPRSSHLVRHGWRHHGDEARLRLRRWRPLSRDRVQHTAPAHGPLSRRRQATHTVPSLSREPMRYPQQGSESGSGSPAST